MFAIELKPAQYLTYLLSDQSAQSQVEVVPERGGIVTRWQIQGQDLLYLDQERFTNPDLTVRGGIPILFPICGNLPDHQYQYQGQTYTLKQHGFARDLPWDVTEQATDQRASLTLTLTSNEKTRTVYPFDFQVAFTYVLQGQTLEIRQRYTNHSREPMPFSTGLHPYFAVDQKSQLVFDLPATQFTDQRTQVTHAFNQAFDWSQDEIDVAFRQLSAECAVVCDRDRQVQLTLEYDSPYRTLVFWTLHNKPFYCLEPWTAPRNALNTGEHLLSLDPGKTWETWVRMTATLI